MKTFIGLFLIRFFLTLKKHLLENFIEEKCCRNSSFISERAPQSFYIASLKTVKLQIESDMIVKITL